MTTKIGACSYNRAHQESGPVYGVTSLARLVYDLIIVARNASCIDLLARRLDRWRPGVLGRSVSGYLNSRGRPVSRVEDTLKRGFQYQPCR